MNTHIRDTIRDILANWGPGVVIRQELSSEIARRLNVPRTHADLIIEQMKREGLMSPTYTWTYRTNSWERVKKSGVIPAPGFGEPQV